MQRTAIFIDPNVVIQHPNPIPKKRTLFYGIVIVNLTALVFVCKTLYFDGPSMIVAVSLFSPSKEPSGNQSIVIPPENPTTTAVSLFSSSIEPSGNPTSTSLPGNPTTTAATSSSQGPTTAVRPREDEPICGYVIKEDNSGRLGNQMFAYAAFYGTVMRREMPEGKVVFERASSNYTFLSFFFENLTMPRRIITDAWLQSRNPIVIGEKACCKFDERVLDEQVHACDGQTVYVTGFRQSYKYFYEFPDEIRQEFTFTEYIRKAANLTIYRGLIQKKLLGKQCVKVGVHLRRGDFLDFEKWRIGYWPAQETFFKDAVRFYEDHLYFGNASTNFTDDQKECVTNQTAECIAFFVFGNDIEWNKKVTRQMDLRKPKQTHFIFVDSRRTTGANDLCAMAKYCDHMIISTGTFSWWAGYLNRGMVVYQKEYARNGTYIYDQYDPDDVFLPSWIPL